MNHSTEKMLMEEIPRIRALLEKILDVQIQKPLAVIPEMFEGTYEFDENAVREQYGLPLLKEGVTTTKNGRYMLAGKFISKREAYV